MKKIYDTCTVTFAGEENKDFKTKELEREVAYLRGKLRKKRTKEADIELAKAMFLLIILWWALLGFITLIINLIKLLQ